MTRLWIKRLKAAFIATGLFFGLVLFAQGQIAGIYFFITLFCFAVYHLVIELQN